MLAQATPFRAHVVLQWLKDRGQALAPGWDTLDKVPTALLMDFATQGLGATAATIARAYQLLQTRKELQTRGPDGLGFSDPRIDGEVRLSFTLPFSEDAYNHPLSPFYHVGHMHKDYKGWWRCPCWKCN